MKTEPDCFGIDDLIKAKNKTAHWDGVRNYQARNMLRDQIRKGDLVFFYHSNATPPGIAGIAEVVKEAYPDHTAFDPENEHYDPRSNQENPRWFMVDVKFQKKFDQLISLDELRKKPMLENMQLLRKGNRLSVMPVDKEHWGIILAMAEEINKY